MAALLGQTIEVRELARSPGELGTLEPAQNRHIQVRTHEQTIAPQIAGMAPLSVFSCLDTNVSSHPEVAYIASASREIGASAKRIFELIADPAQQPRWDGNDNLAEAAGGQRVRAVGDVFRMTTTKGNVRDNHITEFEEDRRIAWRPSEPGQEPPGHLWRWELEPIEPLRTRITHTYDWTQLTDENRVARARATTPDRLQASLDRLALLAERE